MSLLKEIQDGALDTNVPITTVLRKLAVLAAQLKNDELRDWAFSELNGYTGQDVKLPTYRELGASPHGNLSQPGWQQNNAPIPSLILPEGLRERADMLDFRQPIAEIESLAVGDGDGVVFNWPGDWVLWAQKEGKFARGVVLHAIWQKVSKAAVVGIVDTVRTRILEFCIRLEGEQPGLLKAEDGVVATPAFENAARSVYNQVFVMGNNTGPIANSSSGAIQSMAVIVEKGDLPALTSALINHGVPVEAAKELESVVLEEGSNHGIGPKATAWLGKAAAAIGSGVWGVAKDVGTTVITKLLLSYYGIQT